jgi:hypothetical protein
VVRSRLLPFKKNGERDELNALTAIIKATRSHSQRTKICRKVSIAPVERAACVVVLTLASHGR